MRRRWIVAFVLSLALVVGALYGIYRYADPEKLDLTDVVRASTPGKFIALTNGYTHYELGGPQEGRTVVLLAGFSVPYYIWDPTFKALTEAGFRVLRYDYYGRGYSDRPEVAYNVDLHIAQLTQLLDKLGISGAVDLVGLSYGGGVITTFADRYPNRVRTLTYMDPGLRSPFTPPFLSEMPRVWSFLAAVLDERYWPDAQMTDFLHPERHADWPDRYRVQLQYKGFRQARLSEFVNNAGEDQTDEVDRVGANPRPVLVIWGKQDRTVQFDNSEWLMKRMPHGRLLAVEDCGHLAMWEQPTVIHPELIAFLSR